MAPFTRKDAPGRIPPEREILFVSLCGLKCDGVLPNPDDSFQGAPACRQHPALFLKRPGESLIAVSEFS